VYLAIFRTERRGVSFTPSPFAWRRREREKKEKSRRETQGRKALSGYGEKRRGREEAGFSLFLFSMRGREEKKR